VRISEFWYRLRQVYPDADTFATDVAINELNSMTIKEALATGLEPDEVWKILVRREPEIENRWS
jgi:hypothetical protein